jgi:HSP20 family protein
MMVERAFTPWQTPLSLIHALHREMDDLFTRVLGEGEHAGSPAWPALGAYTPQMESWVKDNALHLKADLPGIDPQDVEVTVEGNLLTLRRERKTEQDGPTGQYVHREVRYGEFVRTFTIPQGIKAEDVQASYRNGVLELTIPLPAELLPKKVAIAVEGQANGQRQIGSLP